MDFISKTRRDTSYQFFVVEDLNNSLSSFLLSYFPAFDGTKVEYIYPFNSIVYILYTLMFLFETFDVYNR